MITNLDVRHLLPTMLSEHNEHPEETYKAISEGLKEAGHWESFLKQNLLEDLGQIPRTVLCESCDDWGCEKCCKSSEEVRAKQGIPS